MDWGQDRGKLSLKYCCTTVGSHPGRFWFVDSLYPLANSVAIATWVGKVSLAPTVPPGNKPAAP